MHAAVLAQGRDAEQAERTYTQTRSHTRTHPHAPKAWARGCVGAGVGCGAGGAHARAGAALQGRDEGPGCAVGPGGARRVRIRAGPPGTRLCSHACMCTHACHGVKVKGARRVRI